MIYSERFNTMTFSQKEVETGLHKPLLDYLIQYYSANAEDTFNDIHITSDGECLIIQWVQVPYDRSYGGEFQYIEEDECIMREVILPDNSSTHIYADEDPEEIINLWLQENPGWERGPYGGWVNTAENERIRKELEGDEE